MTVLSPSEMDEHGDGGSEHFYSPDEDEEDSVIVPPHDPD